MKLQHLSIMFLIIIIPIALVLSEYITNNTKILDKQAEYNNILLSSTNDAVRAFQMNTLNNGYSTVTDSKVRDITASVNSFYNSLSAGLGASGYSKIDLEAYIPAMLFTMYDGYYLYGNYQNIMSIVDGKQKYSTESSKELYTANGVQPYIYYTCEYRGTNNFDIVVNYTLDNYISVMGTNKDGDIENISGYLINPDSVTNIDKDNKTLNVHGVTIQPETLGEYIIILDAGKGNLEAYNGGNPTYYQYVYMNHQKYYLDLSPNTDALSYNGINIFRLNNNLRTYLNENEAKILAEYITGNSDYNNLNPENFKDSSAFKYYKDAQTFSKKIRDLFISAGNIEIVTDSYNQQLEYTRTANGEKVPIHLRAGYEPEKIFDLNGTDNNPEKEDSIFNEHRMDVIISSIESNLMSIIANFNIHQNSGYEFVLPILSEEDWYKITNHITTVAFMQGIPIGNYKYYNNYAVVANTKTKEFVSRDSIIIREKETGNMYIDKNGTYHNPRCLELNNNVPPNLTGYSNVDYEMQTVSYDVTNSEYQIDTTMYYYYPHTGSGGYECIIGKENVAFSADNLIDNSPRKIQNSAGDWVDSTEYANLSVRTTYITALAREKYNLYKITDYFNKY